MNLSNSKLVLNKSKHHWIHSIYIVAYAECTPAKTVYKHSVTLLSYFNLQNERISKWKR
nr:MAG TPA: hypothetical protein [Bacteriophage sp.]